MLVDILFLIIGILLMGVSWLSERAERHKKITVTDDKSVVLFDSDVVNKSIQHFRDNIQYPEKVYLFDENSVREIVTNFNSKLKYPETVKLVSDETLNKIKDIINDSLKQVALDVKDVVHTSVQEEKSILEQTIAEAYNEEAQEIKTTKKTFRFNSKSLYEIVEDKYIDLVDKNINECVYDSGYVKYIDNIIIHISTKNSNEFWYMEVKRNNEAKKYGFNSKQKHKIHKLVSYLKYINGEELDKYEQKNFDYIKERIQNAK